MSGYNLYRLGSSGGPEQCAVNPYYVSGIIKARNSFSFIYSFESFQLSPNLKFSKIDPTVSLSFQNDLQNGKLITSINPQQQDYNWGTAELFKWKAYNGKESEGIVYNRRILIPGKNTP